MSACKGPCSCPGQSGVLSSRVATRRQDSTSPPTLKVWAAKANFLQSEQHDCTRNLLEAIQLHPRHSKPIGRPYSLTRSTMSGLICLHIVRATLYPELLHRFQAYMKPVPCLAPCSGLRLGNTRAVLAQLLMAPRKFVRRAELQILFLRKVLTSSDHRFDPVMKELRNTDSRNI